MSLPGLDFDVAELHAGALLELHPMHVAICYPSATEGEILKAYCMNICLRRANIVAGTEADDCGPASPITISPVGCSPLAMTNG